MTPAVEDLRYQHMYHPVPLEQKCPPLARVVQEVASGRFGDGGVYEPYVAPSTQPCDMILIDWTHAGCSTRSASTTTTCSRRTSTPVRLTCRFVTQTPCSFARAWYVDIKALELVDLAYQDRTEWIKKSIRTTAKVRRCFYSISTRGNTWELTAGVHADGQVQLGPRDHGLRAGVLEH